MRGVIEPPVSNRITKRPQVEGTLGELSYKWSCVLLTASCAMESDAQIATNIIGRKCFSRPIAGPPPFFKGLIVSSNPLRPCRFASDNMAGLE